MFSVSFHFHLSSLFLLTLILACSSIDFFERTSMRMRMCMCMCVCMQTVGDLQCDSYSETASNPVLLYVLRAPAAANMTDADSNVSDLNLQSQSSKDKSVSWFKDAGDQSEGLTDRYIVDPASLHFVIPCLALPCLALPCLALPCLALPCLALPCLALPCLALPYLALPCLALPYPTLTIVGRVVQIQELCNPL